MYSSHSHCSVLPMGMGVVFMSFIFCLCDTVLTNAASRRVYLAHSSKGTVHHDGEVTAAGARGSWSHYIYNQEERGGDKCWCPAHFFLYYLGPHSHGMVLPTFSVDLH